MIDKKTLFLDCSSGISGDMFSAMLLDLSGKSKELKTALDSLNLDEFKIDIHEVSKNAIECTKFNVILKEDHHCHDEHHHEEHHQHDGHHVHRNLADIEKIIDESSLESDVKILSKEMFSYVAKAESKIHGKPISEVHFHEVGATDSIVDIVSAAFLIKILKIERVVVSNLTEGHGTVTCAHGIFPVPAPATAEILSIAKIPFKIGNNNGEMITPTGAAILASLNCEFSSMPEMAVLKIGYGAGTKDFEYPNILRGFLGITKLDENTRNKDIITVLETNLDDTTGEELSFCLDELIKAGVLDAFYTPIFMKKNRPAYLLTVLVKNEDVNKASEIIFKNTGSIGIRKRISERLVMSRELKNLETRFGQVPVKFSSFGAIKKAKPEADVIEKISKETSLSFKEVSTEILKGITN